MDYPTPPPLDAPDAEHLRHRLVRVELELRREDLSQRVRSRLYQDHARLARLLEKLNREVRLQEHRLISAPHPTWTRFKDCLFRCLQHQPLELLKAMAEQIEQEPEPPR